MRYLTALTCPYCGGTLEHRAGGNITTWQARALTECQECAAEIVIKVELHATTDNHQPRRPIVHGTDEANYQRCRRAGPEACPPCKTAHTAYTAARRKAVA